MPGNDWKREEVAAIVPDYFDMLTKELSGKNYGKAEHRRQLRKIIYRSHGAIERKHMNISAILVEKYLQAHPELDPLINEFLLSDITTPEIKNILKSEVEVPDFDKRFNEDRIEYVNESETNYYVREQRNKKLGLLGEKFVIKYEKQKLLTIGQENLADKIEHISQTVGDSAGFDILSFDDKGNEKFIEVKTTKLDKNSPFYFTRNELGLSRNKNDQYSLYRVFRFQKKPQFYQLQGALDKTCKSISTEYMGWPK
ncbi:DUF3883 domain-containing protein [Aliifodinibius sp. S!AR15-10]|uniref:DUF3883 domain-containing protein n=1 Tax=Aliifodinibius sp. S!AR15-10 TaxID=2950437 RepID=UPI002854C3FB|nr:DUF3883 domain-containing protein [Aliifodinibius sp. S!AR15-10]MDR8391407.1 DUF3883 domain-containing protein [Aliifodinibius sp. S!AR15-10]